MNRDFNKIGQLYLRETYNPFAPQGLEEESPPGNTPTTADPEGHPTDDMEEDQTPQAQAADPTVPQAQPPAGQQGPDPAGTLAEIIATDEKAFDELAGLKEVQAWMQHKVQSVAQAQQPAGEPAQQPAAAPVQQPAPTIPGGEQGNPPLQTP